MEGKTRAFKSVLVLVLIMGGLIGVSKALPFPECYMACFLECIAGGEGAVECSLKCLAECIVGPVKNKEYFCNLGCACSSCSDISTRENPAAEKVEGCVNSCSDTCVKQ